MSLPRILLVDDEENVRSTLQKVLALNNFEVVTASGVNEALHCIGAERFDVLLTDLRMPGRGDGLTVVSAMRHANPQAITLVFTGSPEMKEAATAILLQADEILVKPLNMPDLLKAIGQKLVSRTQSAPRVTESVANIMESNNDQIIQDWLIRVNDNQALMQVPLSAPERTGHLPKLLSDLVARLRGLSSINGKHPDSKAAHEHGKLRRMQGYSAPMIVEESRMLQVSIFGVLQKNLARVDFSLILIDVMTIADEVDDQLCQAMQTFAEQSPPVDLAA